MSGISREIDKTCYPKLSAPKRAIMSDISVRYQQPASSSLCAVNVERYMLCLWHCLCKVVILLCLFLCEVVPTSGLLYWKSTVMFVVNDTLIITLMHLDTLKDVDSMLIGECSMCV